MTNFIKKTKKRLSRKQSGQILVVVAFAIVGIVAIIGLSLDVGVMFIENARLRRAVDAAALAAALQYREGYQMDYLDRTAREFLILNGINAPGARVLVCNGPVNHDDPALCPLPGQPPRKFVRVVATGIVRLAFLPVIGIPTAPIGAEAISETASLDVVLVIDRSDSMTWDAGAPGNPGRDPSICNTGTSGGGYIGDCHPFDEVKRAAVDFVGRLYFPYDRVAVVTFDKDEHLIMQFSNDPAVIIDNIKNLTVFQGDPMFGPGGINAIYPNGLPSRWYDINGDYYGLDCPQTDPDLNPEPPPYPYPDFPSPGPCTTTNIGAGLNTAGLVFNIPPVRQESLWVVILLTDGVANAGQDEDGRYLCPDSTWGNSDIPPKCNDGDSSTRHSPISSGEYDAEDFAYDAADFVANGQNALVFTIGLGSKVTQLSTVDGTALGEVLLQYAADEGEGLYYNAPTSGELLEVFRKIAENIATRLTH